MLTAPGPPAPLTVGTAGHVDHGKTALVQVLTGTDTDRLAEEKARGLSIELGFAEVELESGRRLSLIDVPGHERFIRTMVAGATGIDCYLMVLAATEGVRQQTLEHARILRALSIDVGIVVVTKTDLADPAAARREAAELLPEAEVVICPPRMADRRAPVLAALERAARRARGRIAEPGQPPILHIDRRFSVAGAGTVVTGTLVCGEIAAGDHLTVLPQDVEVRVRGLQVHGRQLPRAQAGQRVAVNLARVGRVAIERGDVLAGPGAVGASFVLEAALDGACAQDGVPRLVQAHHGTRGTPARVRSVPDSDLIRLHLRHALMARPGDHIVLRDAASRRTLGGAVVVDPHPWNRLEGDSIGRNQDFSRAGRGASSAPAAPPAKRSPAAAPAKRAPTRPPAALGLADTVDEAELARVEAEIRAAVAADGCVTLPGLRDRLGVSRRRAKAFLDYFDNAGVTLRRADDRRVLRGRHRPGAADAGLTQPQHEAADAGATQPRPRTVDADPRDLTKT
jgi:selenocysteine-specific elongation factor